MYVRSFNYTYPTAFLQFNSDLFKYAGQVYNETNFGIEGFVFPNYTTENHVCKNLLNSYFPPIRTSVVNDPPSKNFIIVSNFAVIPEMRLTMMGPFSELLARSGDALMWRYDMLNYLIRAAYGTIDLETAIHIAAFTAPNRTPGYWDHELMPGEPMSAQVEGALSIVSFEENTTKTTTILKIHTKFGYWSDDFVNITLTNYFA